MTVVDAWTEPRPVKLTARDFLQLAEAGALDAHPRTELIDGVIVAMSPQHSTHSRVHGILYQRLVNAVAERLPGYSTLIEVSVQISEHQMPQADLVVTNYDGPDAPIPGSTVALLVEIAHTTAKFDRITKASIYAAGGIPEYWVIDIPAAEVVRFGQPVDGVYREEKPVPFGMRVDALTISGLAIDTSAFTSIRG